MDSLHFMIRTSSTEILNVQTYFFLAMGELNWAISMFPK